MKSIPVCPRCGKRQILMLTDDMTIRCMKSAGGCGAEFPLDDFAKLYQEEKPPLPGPARKRPYVMRTEPKA